MALRDFRFLFSGSATSLLGDQFALIATPWLVLQLTGDPLALGIVLALEGIPRAAFMLLGGAITDRFSPRWVMFVADIIRLALTAMMALVVLTGMVEIWMIYAFSLGFGLVAGFAIPAQNSIVPKLVEERDLQAGNSIIMGITQLMGFIGPTVAGVVIGGYSQSYTGVGLAFGIDAATFLISAVYLWLIGSGNKQQLSGNSAKNETVWAAILTGMKNLWEDKTLGLMFFVIATLNFLLVGPLMVGIPVLADQRLPEGAVAFGLLMSAFSGGNLIGYLAAGSLPRPTGLTMRLIAIVLLAAFGTVIASLGFISSTWIDFALLFGLGLGNGYMSIIMFTWIQTRTPKELLGRMMSLFMFANTGLAPVSQALSGVVSKWDLSLMFLLAGGMILALTFWAAFQPGLKDFSESLVGQPVGEGEPGIVSSL
jgi:MFS family permease